MRASYAATFAILAGMPLLCSGQQPRLAARIEFRCLWWSAEQQRNFDPNRPPPKATEVVIDRWEYTDPVGTPNPDQVTAVVEIRNDGDAKAGPLRVTAEIRWKTGPQTKPELARWERRQPLAVKLMGGVAAGERVEIQTPIDLRARMAALERREWWPHELEVIVTGRLRANGRTVFEAIRPFAIRPGD